MVSIICIGIALFLIATIMIIINLAVPGDMFVPNFMLILIGCVFLIPLTFFLFKGPTSEVALTTQASKDTLILTGFLYKDIKLLKKLEPYIRNAQGNFTQKNLVEKLDNGK